MLGPQLVQLDVANGWHDPFHQVVILPDGVVLGAAPFLEADYILGIVPKGLVSSPRVALLHRFLKLDGLLIQGFLNLPGRHAGGGRPGLVLAHLLAPYPPGGYRDLVGGDLPLLVFDRADAGHVQSLLSLWPGHQLYGLAIFLWPCHLLPCFAIWQMALAIFAIVLVTGPSGKTNGFLRDSAPLANSSKPLANLSGKKAVYPSSLSFSVSGVGRDTPREFSTKSFTTCTTRSRASEERGATSRMSSA